MLHFLVLIQLIFNDERKFSVENENEIVVEIVSEKNFPDNFSELKIPERVFTSPIENVYLKKKVNFGHKNFEKNKIKKPNDMYLKENYQPISFKGFIKKDNYEKKQILNAEISINDEPTNYYIENLKNIFFQKFDFRNFNPKLHFDQNNIPSYNFKINNPKFQKEVDFSKVSKIQENLIYNKKVDLSDLQEIKKISLYTISAPLFNSDSRKIKKIFYPNISDIEDINYKKNNDQLVFWGEMIKNKISNNLFYPKKAINNQIKGTVFLKLKVSVDGLLISLDITQSSGFKILDLAALKAVKKLKNLPKAPKEIKNKFIVFNLPVNFNL